VSECESVRACVRARACVCVCVCVCERGIDSKGGRERYAVRCTHYMTI
jgi:hypothetical protein